MSQRIIGKVCSLAIGVACMICAASLYAAGAAAGGGTGGPVQVAAADFPRPAKPSMGVNLEGVNDFARSMMFVDMIKSGRKFGSADKPWDQNAEVDANGWPTGDAGVVIAADTPVPAGDYSFSCTGHCQLETVASNASVKNQSWHGDTKTTTAVVTVNPDSQSLFLALKNTDHGVQNIRLLRPGYPLNSTEVFSKEFLAALAPFSTLRMMDFTRTNGNDSKEWSDRPKTTDALQTSNRGVAWEYAILLANEAHKDLWINIPVLASDDYVKQLAELFKSKLNKDRAVYVEYSNEVWNGIFPQFHQNLDAAKAEVAAGNSPLDDHGNDKNEYYWAWKRVSKRLVEIATIFKAVYGPDAVPGTATGTAGGHGPMIRPVLASQSANPFMLRVQLEYIEKNCGAPSRIIYGVAGAPYLGVEGKISDREDLTANELFKSLLPHSMETVRQWMLDYQVLARYYRLHSLCYEGGQALEGEHSSQAKLAANRDDRMGPLLHDYLTAWYSTGGELFMYFNLASSYTKWGAWGLSEDIRKSSPKLKAMMQLCAAPTPSITVGFAVPGMIPAEQFHSHDGGRVETNPDHTADLANLGKDNTFDYLVNVPAAGNYALSLLTASTQGDAVVEILFSGQSVGTLTSKNTGNWETYAPTSVLLMHLPPGQIVLRLKIANAGLNIRAVKLEKR